MNPFHLITDSTADLPAQYYKEHQVECMPFTYILEDTPHTDVPGETDLTAIKRYVKALCRRRPISIMRPSCRLWCP